MTIGTFNKLLNENNYKVGFYSKNTGWELIQMETGKIKYFPSLLDIVSFLEG